MARKRKNPVVKQTEMGEVLMLDQSALLNMSKIAGRQGGLVRPTDAARMLGVSRERVHILIQKGKLQCWKLASVSLVSVKEVSSYGSQRDQFLKARGMN